MGGTANAVNEIRFSKVSQLQHKATVNCFFANSFALGIDGQSSSVFCPSIIEI